MAYNDERREVSFEIIEEIGVLSTQSTGWTKEINVVSWNGGVPRYDIREWDPLHERMSRGLTLQEEEMRHLLDLMRRRRQYSSRRSSAAVAGQGQVNDSQARDDHSDEEPFDSGENIPGAFLEQDPADA